MKPTHKNPPNVESTTYDNFRNFLRQSGCEEAFDLAFYSQNGATPLDSALWHATSDPTFIFGHAFRWASTAEGSDYWRTIDKLWQEKLKR